MGSLTGDIEYITAIENQATPSDSSGMTNSTNLYVHPMVPSSTTNLPSKSRYTPSGHHPASQTHLHVRCITKCCGPTKHSEEESPLH